MMKKTEMNPYIVAYTLLWLNGEISLEGEKKLEIPYPPTQEKTVIKMDLLKRLSEDAKKVVKITLENDLLSRESIRRVLRKDNGWKHDYISLIFQELKTFTVEAF